MKNINLLYEHTVKRLEDLSIRYTVHHFPSGAIMLDIWVNNKFYVLQFETDCIGISEINDDNIGIDLIPNERFYNEIDYKVALEIVLNVG